MLKTKFQNDLPPLKDFTMMLDIFPKITTVYIVTLEKVCMCTSDGGRACTWQANDGGRALWTKCGRFTETGESAWTEPSWCTNEKGIDIVTYMLIFFFFI